MKLSPTGFQSHILWRLVFPVGSIPLSPVVSLPFVVVSSEVWLLTEFLPPYPFCYDFLSMINCGESVLPVFKSFSGLIVLMWLLYTYIWDNVSLGSSYSTIFNVNIHFCPVISSCKWNATHIYVWTYFGPPNLIITKPISSGHQTSLVKYYHSC